VICSSPRECTTRRGATLCRYLGLALIAAVSNSCSVRPYDPSRRSPEQLIADLQNGTKPRIQVAAARRLGKIRASAATQPLIAALQSPALDLRQAAITALGEIQDPRAVEPLIDSLLHGERPIERSAAKALAGIKDPRAVDPLRSKLEVLGEEGYADLAGIGQPAVATLIDLLRDIDTREAATKALVQMGGPAVAPLLELLRRDPGPAHYGAAKALAESGDANTADALNQALQGGDIKLAAASYRFLIRSGGPAAEDLLEKALGEYGDLEMAEDLRACGNVRLRAVAEKWKADHGFSADFSVDSFRTEQPVKWGSSPR
jgi:HEAT repeat protein